MAGAAAGHGPKWAKTVRSLGGKPQRCHDAVAGVREAMAAIANYTGKCAAGHTTTRDRKSHGMFVGYCSTCWKTKKIANKFVWKDKSGRVLADDEAPARRSRPRRRTSISWEF